MFSRVKAILFNPKEEWEVIEAENPSHAKVLPYLLILALIPVIAFFANYWMQWNSGISKATEIAISEASKYNYSNEQLAKTLATIKESSPFDLTMGIIYAVQYFITIVGGAYVAAAVINALSDQFGVTNNFGRTFSLVAYSYTPLCLAGILYIYTPLVWLVPIFGLYGVYLLYLGVNPLIKPAAEKQTGYIIMALLVTLIIYVIISKIAPMVTTQIYSSIITANAPIQNP
ncbi:MAG: YIP1 family protein [Candidatus Azobacteroides sp.]|nr:YIP1 family protein [Candidatus Azobacteroides sp.]